jgi:hypothetical protein
MGGGHMTVSDVLQLIAVILAAIKIGLDIRK